MLLFSLFLKAIEEIDINDKAVAAAVNEAIECNTNVSVFLNPCLPVIQTGVTVD